MKPLRFTNLYFQCRQQMHSLVRMSSIVRRKGFMKPAPGLSSVLIYSNINSRLSCI